MNLLDILENNMLLEAIRINNGKEAVNLIRSNQIGVKIDPSYKNKDLSNLESVFNNIINRVGMNDAAFAVQLLVNKVPLDSLNKAASSDALLEIVKCRNKPWAKQIPGYIDVISLSSRTKYDENAWHKLEKDLQEEGQRHGKSNKGGGNIKDVNILYPLDSNGWVLYQPTSWEGAKAVSFYINNNGQKIPTEWCTRANKGYYDRYTENNTKYLYIIRNDKLHKAYQMAVRKDQVDFLDQNDKKGDEIVLGDLSGLPENLLNKVNIGKGTLLDYRNNYDKYNKRNGNRNVKDPFDENTVWSKEKLVHRNPDIYRQVCLNYISNKEDPLELYNNYNTTKQKKEEAIIRYRINVRAGDDIYYFSNSKSGYDGHPWAKKNYEGKFVTIDRKELHNRFPRPTKYDNFDSSDLTNFESEIFLKDYNKRNDRKKSRRDNSSFSYREIEEELETNLSRDLNKVINKYIEGLELSVEVHFQNADTGGVIPTHLEFVALEKNSYDTVARIKLLRDRNGKFNFNESPIYKEHQSWMKVMSSFLGAEDTKKMDKEILETINRVMKEKVHKLLANKVLRARRETARTRRRGLYYENYFPY